MPLPARYRFRPRFRGLAVLAMVLGLALGGYGLVAGGAASTALVVIGMGGAALGGLYLGSPAWRMEVVVHDDALEVLASGDRRFRLPWSEVTTVIASPATETCFVDGGAPERSLLVPGDGAPAPYAIEDAAGLYRAIVARTPPERVREVALLETTRRAA
ncbi:MAG: hypothetical protein K8M05_11265, partial [Deltaproteobacteria bacterium]|nr:hypothetical protein [Kofleriaceae bacterium]